MVTWEYSGKRIWKREEEQEILSLIKTPSAATASYLMNENTTYTYKLEHFKTS